MGTTRSISLTCILLTVALLCIGPARALAPVQSYELAQIVLSSGAPLGDAGPAPAARPIAAKFGTSAVPAPAAPAEPRAPSIGKPVDRVSAATHRTWGYYQVSAGNPAPDCDPPICWMGGDPEGEVDCYDGYIDTFNAGCNSKPASWGTTISCGQTICGTSGNYLVNIGQYRDTDWFVWTITEDTEFTFAVRADFPVVIGLVETSAVGSGNCADFTGYVSPYALGDPCQQVSITQCVPGPGTYWLFVSTQGFEGVPCGSEYEATLTCGAVRCAGYAGLPAGHPGRAARLRPV